MSKVLAYFTITGVVAAFLWLIFEISKDVRNSTEPEAILLDGSDVSRWDSGLMQEMEDWYENIVFPEELVDELPEPGTVNKCGNCGAIGRRRLNGKPYCYDCKWQFE